MMKEQGPTLKWIAKVAFVLLWLLLMVGGYFWAHKPFDGAIALQTGETLFSIVAWLGLSGLGAALGYRALGETVKEERPFPRLALGIGVGLGLIAVIMGILGLIGLIHVITAWTLVILLTFLLRGELRSVWADLRALSLPRPANNFQRWIAVYGGANLLLTFLAALAPVTAWDSLTYHLRGPLFYIEAGRITHPVNIPHLGFPLVGQMQFTLGMLLVGDGAAALLHFGYGLISLVLVAVLARRVFGESVAWLAGTIFLSIPTLFTLMRWPYVDMMLLFYATAAFYAFYRWRKERQNGWLIALGLVCGFAGGVKYTAVAIPIALGLSIIWESRRDGLVASARRLALVALPAGLLVTPWLIENGITTGNPVYPFFFNDALYWDEWRAWWYDRPGTGLWATAPWRLLLVPLEATIAGTEGSNFYEATIGPFILSSLFFLPLIWSRFRREQKALLAHMGLFFLINYLLWLNGVARTALLLRARFLFFVFGVTAVIGGAALDKLTTLTRPQLDVAWLVRTFISITLAGLLFTQLTTFLEINPLPPALGLEPEDAYVRRRLGAYQPAMARLNELPPASEVMFLWETRSYACREVLCHPDPILDRFLHLTHYKGYDAAEITAVWEERGITHVLLYQGGLDFLLEQGTDPILPQDLTILRDLQENYWTPVERWGDAYTLYQINPRP